MKARYHVEEYRGYLGFQLQRKQLDYKTEFITTMWFDSKDSVKEFAGKDYEKEVVPEKTQRVLDRFDLQSRHYEVRIKYSINND